MKRRAASVYLITEPSASSEWEREHIGHWVAYRSWTHDATGQRVRSRGWGKLRRDAEAFLATAETARREALDVWADSARGETGTGNMLLPNLVSMWLGARKADDEPMATVRIHESAWRVHLLKELGHIGIDDLTRAHAYAALKKVGRHTTNDNPRSMLSALLTWAADSGHRADGTNVMKGMGSTKSQMLARVTAMAANITGTPEPRAISEDEHRLLTSLAVEWESGPTNSTLPVSAILTTLWHTGVRIGELLSWQWRDICLDHEVPHAHIRSTMTYEPQPVRVEHRKSNGAPFVVALAPDVVDILRERQAANATRARSKQSDFVWATRTGAPVEAGNLRQRIRMLTASRVYRTKGTAKKGTLVRYTEERLLPPEVTALRGLTPHAYKRGMVTDAEESFGLKVAAEFGGHSVGVAQKHYVKVRGLRILDPGAFRVLGEAENDPDNAAGNGA